MTRETYSCQTVESLLRHHPASNRVHILDMGFPIMHSGLCAWPLPSSLAGPPSSLPSCRWCPCWLGSCTWAGMRFLIQVPPLTWRVLRILGYSSHLVKHDLSQCQAKVILGIKSCCQGRVLGTLEQGQAGKRGMRLSSLDPYVVLV